MHYSSFLAAGPTGRVDSILQIYQPCGTDGAAAGGEAPTKVHECGDNACCKTPISGGDYNYSEPL